MSVIEFNGASYVSGMSWEERLEVLEYLKPVKTYDYLYFIPYESFTQLLAVKAFSIMTTIDIPIVFPGILCVDGPTFINGLNKADGVVDKSMSLPYIYFASIKDTISTFNYIGITGNETGFNMHLQPQTNSVIVIPAYGTINRIQNMLLTMTSYKISSTRIDVPQEALSSLVDELRLMKADDGAAFYNIDNCHIITIYAGMFPLNKSDRLSITIYDDPMSDRFILKGIVYKGKKQVTEISTEMFLLKLI